MLNSCQVTCQSFLAVITQPKIYKLPTDIWIRHSDCMQLCLDFTACRDHDSAWSPFTTRNGFVSKAVYLRTLHRFCGLTAKPVAVCKLLAFDQCVTMKSSNHDCMKVAENDVCTIHDGKNTPVVGETLWGNTRVFDLPNWIGSPFSFSQSYQLRVGHLLESMFAGSIAFFRWFTVSTLTHVHCDEHAHVWSRLYVFKLNGKHCMRCQVPTTHQSMLPCVLADDCTGFRIKVQKHHIIVGHLHRIRSPNIKWWIDMPKDFPIGEASNPGPE